MNKPKWRLVWDGKVDAKALKLVAEHCSTYYLFKDAKAHLINYAEYIALLSAKDIAPAQSYWQIRPKQVGLIALSAYDIHTTTWDAILACKSDFLAGYYAAGKKHE